MLLRRCSAAKHLAAGELENVHRFEHAESLLTLYTHPRSKRRDRDAIAQVTIRLTYLSGKTRAKLFNGFRRSFLVYLASHAVCAIETVAFKLILQSLMSLRNNAIRRQFKHAPASWKEVSRFVPSTHTTADKPCVLRQFLLQIPCCPKA